MTHKEIPVITPNGEGVIETITISELKQLMVRIRYEDTWVNYSIGDVEEALNLKEIKFKNEEKINNQRIGVGRVC
jgi:hypothetical protein